MRLTAVVGSLRKLLEADVKAGERAVTQAVKAETEALKQTLRSQVNAAFGPKSRGLANAWRSRVFPRTGESLGAAGVVSTKVPSIIDAFERGALIQSRKGKFLAIPTGFNAARGRRGRGQGGLRVTPAQMVASGQAFLVPFKNGGGFVWALPVRQGEQVGRRRAPLIAGGITAVATGNRRGKAQFQAALLKQGFVPMFLMLRQVQLPKKLNVRAAGAAALANLPRRIVTTWNAQAANNNREQRLGR